MALNYKLCTVFFGAILLLSACGGGGGGSSAGFFPVGNNQPSATNHLSAPKILTLSNRADLISGGDALVEIVPTSESDSSTLKVKLNDQDITAAFATRQDGRYIGMVTGLKDGSNLITASAKDTAIASLSVINHVSGSPVIYGPQVTPWVCDAGATDLQCNRPISYKYLYKSTDAKKVGFIPFDPAEPPSDVATAITDSGARVPFVIRVETGAINRDYYNIAVLFDSAKSWSPWEPQSAWNKKVVVTHGAGAGTSYGQYGVITAANVLSERALSKGYAVMSTALNDNGHNVNIAVQAESMMMLKEHFVETYGEMLYVMGMGSSGGSIAQQWVANAYPGIYDGLIVGASFPDTGTPAVEIEDCGLMLRYFSDSKLWASGVAWSEVERNAAQGASGDTCTDWAHTPRNLGLDVPFGYTQIFDPSHHGLVYYSVPGLVSPTGFGGCDAPEGFTYQALSASRGIRCTFQDYMVGVMGRRGADGFANRPYANVGVQYGLKALNAGAISPAQFVDLNEKIGSHDIDFKYQVNRVQAAMSAAIASYQSGWINSAHGLSQVPIIDLRSPDTTGIHHQFRSWAMRARLDAAQGNHINQVIWFNTGKTMDQALDAMDIWLTAVRRDNTDSSLPRKVSANRPKDLVDLCGNKDATALSMEQCTGTSDGSPRMAAGGPLNDDVLVCKLKPLSRTSYPIAFTDADWSRLEVIFPNGVCDYSVAGDSQQPALKWPSYIGGDGKIVYGGAALPAVPGSRP